MSTIQSSVPEALLRLAILLSLLACTAAPSRRGGGDEGASGDAVQQTDGTDATEQVDGTDGSDGTNETDGTDGTDGTEGTDGAGETDGTDVTDGTDGTDETDETDCVPSCAGVECGDNGCGGSCGTCSGGGECIAGDCVGCTPFCQPSWECGDDSCGGECGEGCGAGEICNLQVHQCEEDVVTTLAKFGELCGPTFGCQPVLPNGAENPAYASCLNAQCETGVCLVSLTGQGVCGKNCNLAADSIDAAGNPGPDGVEDPGALSGCTGAADGPYGTDFACVALLSPSVGQTLNTCLPGTSFAPCDASGDCPAGESCQLQYILSDYSLRCSSAHSAGIPAGGSCAPDLGPPCESELCFNAGFCSAFCTSDDDCGASQECKPDLQLFSDPSLPTFDVCLGHGCGTNADCPGGFCAIFTNGETNQGLDWAHACTPNASNASSLGGACGDSGPACNGLCLNSGVCSALCTSDADCASDLTEMICGTNETPFDFEDDGVDDKILPLGLCFEAVGSRAPCFTDADCANTGDDEVCSFFELTDPDTGAIDGHGLCTEAAPGEAAVGEACGGPTDVRCKSGFCLSATETQSGYCSDLCQGKDTCPETFVYGDTTYKMACRGYVYGEALTLGVPEDDVWLPLCTAVGIDDSLTDCSTDFTCEMPGESCLGMWWGFGATGPTGMDFMCALSDGPGDAPATGTLGDPCDVSGTNESANCASLYCQPDVVAGAGYCSQLCATDEDCAGAGEDMVCHQHPIIHRPDPEDSVTLPLCSKAASCIPCTYDSDCAGDYVCATVGAAGDRRCAPTCETDTDCAATDGGPTCVTTGDASACVPTSCQ